MFFIIIRPLSNTPLVDHLTFTSSFDLTPLDHLRSVIHQCLDFKPKYLPGLAKKTSRFLGPTRSLRRDWMFLDPETQFVSARHVDAAGWTGDPDDIVVFHMLHHGGWHHTVDGRNPANLLIW